MSCPSEATIERVKGWVATEFSFRPGLFTPLQIQMNLLEDKKGFQEARKPGVYVFVHDEHGVVKVGKSQANAAKRALEHCRDNTKSKDSPVTIQMKELRHSPEMYLLVFVLTDLNSMHWLLALEHFLEVKAAPKIRSVRNG